MNDKTGTETLDVESIRSQFPILSLQVQGKPLVYLDNAATSQKPDCVLKTMDQYYRSGNSNVHRGVHYLSDTATERFEEARKTVRRFLNAADPCEIIWTRGTTESLNLVAQSYGRSTLKPGDVILVSETEHHSNIVPWQLVAGQTGARVQPIPILDSGAIDQQAFDELLDNQVRILALGHVSNALGTIHPIAEMIQKARRKGVITVIDGAQAAPHFKIDVQALGCDFYAFSGHKVFGPTGIGVLYGRKALLEAMPPWQGGGEMIEQVSFDGTTFNDLPHRFEAGTPAIAEAIGLASALDWLDALPGEQLARHEQALLQEATRCAGEVPGLRILGTTTDKVPVLSFVVDGTHPGDLGTLLDHYGYAVRTGHHCTQPLMHRLGIPGTVRASFAVYNTIAEVQGFFEALQRCITMCRQET